MKGVEPQAEPLCTIRPNPHILGELSGRFLLEGFIKDTRNRENPPKGRFMTSLLDYEPRLVGIEAPLLIERYSGRDCAIRDEVHVLGIAFILVIELGESVVRFACWHCVYAVLELADDLRDGE